MLSFILLRLTHQKQLLDRWPFLRLPPGSWQIDTLFFCLQECVCVWSGMRPLVLIQKCFSHLAACIFLKHQSNLNSHTDVCRALPLVNCVHSAAVLYIKLFNHPVRCSLHASAQLPRAPLFIHYKMQPFGLFTGGACGTAGNRPRANRNTRWRPS